jgi:hypothetical protein
MGLGCACTTPTILHVIRLQPTLPPTQMYDIAEVVPNCKHTCGSSSMNTCAWTLQA